MQHYTICVSIPFNITLSHFMQCHTICVYAVPFDITLCHLTQRYTVYMCTVPFKITLSHFTQHYTVCAYAVLLDTCSGTRTQLMKLKEIICAKCSQQCTRQQIGPDSTFFEVNCDMRDFFSWLQRDEILK